MLGISFYKHLFESCMYVLVVRAFFAALFIQPSCIMHTESVLKLNFTVQVFPFVRLSGIALFRANSFVLAAAHTHSTHTTSAQWSSNVLPFGYAPTTVIHESTCEKNSFTLNLWTNPCRECTTTMWIDLIVLHIGFSCQKRSCYWVNGEHETPE